MTQFRPCIDLHDGKVKQIVGGSLRDQGGGPQENFVSEKPPSWFAALFREQGVQGGHVIKLGPGNDAAARDALSAWPGGLQLGGGVTIENAADWLEAGASHVIVTSWLFDDQARFIPDRARALAQAVGRERVVIDLSCRRDGALWRVAMNRWQTPTDLLVDANTLAQLAECADEFLIHAAEVEGLQAGMDEALISRLGVWSPIPVTYAGGARNLADLELVRSLSGNRVHLTIGSALDIFGGKGVSFAECVSWNLIQQGA